MTKVLDAAFPSWTPEQLKAAGIPGVCRYLSWLPNSKVITKAEYDALLRAGVPVTLNWESTGRSWRGGYSQGVKDGAEARRQARALGHPDSRPIIQSMDEAVTDFVIAAEYQRGFNDGGLCGPQGAYGTCAVLDYLFDRRLIVVGWQTNARAWYGNQPDCTRAALRQRTSHSFPMFVPQSYDENDIFLPDWGQHPAPGGPAPTVQEEDDTLMLIPSRALQDPAHPMAKGRVGVVTFDPETKTVIGWNGIAFSKATGFQHDDNYDAFGLHAQRLTLPVQGDLEIGETPDGKCVVVFANGDGGTFLLPYAKVLPQDAKVGLDYAAIAAHLEVEVSAK